MLRKIGDWLDERTGWRASLAAWIHQPVVGGAAWAVAIGASVATCIGVLALTGIVLMTAYAPSPQSAWASVHYVQYVQDRGWIVRGLHYWAAQALLVLAAVHVAHGAISAGYRKPRELVWWLTIALPLLAVGEGITGGLLPWDQRGWWARVVEGNIIGLAPGVGGWLQQMMAGGPELGALGLARAYALHVVVLPLGIGLVLWLRRALVLRQGWAESAASKVAYGRVLAREAVVGAAVVFALFALVGATRGAPLDAPADPMSDYPARPEWFLLTLFEVRKFFHGPLEFWGTQLVPAAGLLVLVAMPWIDRPPRPRGVAVALALAVFAGAVVLTALAVRNDAHDESYAKQRARADARAAAAVRVAMNGVPPAGALEMVRQDPELRGHDVFEAQCASCHVLGDLGDPKKATAAKLDGWTTPEWIAAMIHDPDAPQFFGQGPYKDQMPSVDVRPKNLGPTEAWSPMLKDDAEKRAVVAFLAAEGDEGGDPPPAHALDGATRAKGEKIVSERCTACHLYKGDGDDEGMGLAPELAHYGSIAWTRAQVANPATAQTYRDRALDESLKKHMPRFDKDLSATDLDIVARCTRAHARGVPLR
jgi:ubiquinol-cytochrome c reductase cytochrome b subunit